MQSFVFLFLSWTNLVASTRAKFYFLNYFSMREIMHISELLTAAAAADTEPKYTAVLADVCAHFHLITSFVQTESVALFVKQWLQSQVWINFWMRAVNRHACY